MKHLVFMFILSTMTFSKVQKNIKETDNDRVLQRKNKNTEAFENFDPEQPKPAVKKGEPALICFDCAVHDRTEESEFLVDCLGKSFREDCPEGTEEATSTCGKECEWIFEAKTKAKEEFGEDAVIVPDKFEEDEGEAGGEAGGEEGGEEGAQAEMVYS